MVKAMKQDQDGQVRAPGTRSQPQVVAGLLDPEGAERLAERLDEKGIPARVADGSFAAEGRFGSQVLRGAVAGALIAIPIGVLVALLAWSRNHAGVSPLVPLFFIGAAIVAIGAGLGAFFAVARGAPLVEQPTADQSPAALKEVVKGGDSSCSPSRRPLSFCNRQHCCAFRTQIAS